MFATDSLTTAALGNPFAIWLGDLAVKGLLLFATAAVVALLLAACRAPASVRHFGWLLAIMASIALPGLSLVLPQWTIKFVRPTPLPSLMTRSAAGFPARGWSGRLRQHQRYSLIVEGQVPIADPPSRDEFPPGF